MDTTDYKTSSSSESVNSDVAKEKKHLKSGGISERHCLCDSRDYSTFMICCDKCQIWYHGDCVQISRTMSKKIEKFYCSICVSEDSSLQIVYKFKKEKERTPKIEESTDLPEKREKRSFATSCTVLQQPLAEKDKCGNCIGCLWKTDCGSCANCSAEKQPCLKRICVQAGHISLQASQSNSFGIQPRKRKFSKSLKRESEDADWKASASPPQSQTKSGRRLTVKCEINGGSVTTGVYDDKRVKKEKEASNASISANLAKVYNAYYRQKKRKNEEKKQCFGPGCVNSSRPGSGYCSDDCGMALAERRLKFILPDRIRNFYEKKPESQQQDEEKLRVLLENKNKLEIELKSLDECVDNVMNWISTLRSVQNNGCSFEPNSVDDGAFVVTCAVCTVECSIRNIGKHMQRCFVRTERQSTYGTAHKLPQNPRNLLCDAYNKIDKSYCKRLRVMCSEHYKEEEEEIKFCGAPLIWFDGKAVEFKNLFVDSEILSEKMFCMEKRKHCNVHSNWAQTALGLIDNERMNILYQLDENNEKCRRLKQSQTMRGDVISLLCNYTVSEKGKQTSALEINGD